MIVCLLHAALAAVMRYYDRRGRILPCRGGGLFLSPGGDGLLAPVQPYAPLTLAEINTLGDQPELILKLQRYTAPFDLTGHPTVTLPGGFGRCGMPIGLQLAGCDEITLCRVAMAFQRVTAWHRRHPLP